MESETLGPTVPTTIGGPKRLPRATETTTLGTRGGSHVLSNRLSNYATHRLNDGRLENEMLGE